MKVPILLPNIFNHPFTYESDINLKVGDYVVVPFGKSKITGVVWDEFEKKNNRNFKIKNVLKKLNIVPLKKTTIKFSYSLVEAFDDLEKSPYLDFCHTNHIGNKIIAENIWNNINNEIKF